MDDGFSRYRRSVLMQEQDIYTCFFSEARSKTKEHNVYERSLKCIVCENEKERKTKKNGDN